MKRGICFVSVGKHELLVLLNPTTLMSTGLFSVCPASITRAVKWRLSVAEPPRNVVIRTLFLNPPPPIHPT